MEVWIFRRYLEKIFPQTPMASKALSWSFTVSHLSISLWDIYAFLNRQPCNIVFKQGQLYWNSDKSLWFLNTKDYKDGFSINMLLLWAKDSWAQNSFENKLPFCNHLQYLHFQISLCHRRTMCGEWKSIFTENSIWHLSHKSGHKIQFWIFKLSTLTLFLFYFYLAYAFCRWCYTLNSVCNP